MRKIGIVTPSYDGKVICDYAITIAEVFRLAPQNFDIHLNFWMYEALVQKARNNLFADAMNAGMDDLVFIDGDQAFNPLALFRILEHPVDVVGLPVRMKTDEERYNIRPEDPLAHEFDIERSLLEVENIGTGFLRLSRKAMQALWDASPEYNDDGKIRRMICDLQIIDGGIISEDIQICTKLRNAGFKIYVDVEDTCSHTGTKTFYGNYHDFYLSALKKELAQ